MATEPYAEVARRIPALGRAMALQRAGRLDEARATFLHLTDQGGELAAICQHQLALLAAARGDVPQAVERLRRALALAPGQPMLLHALAAMLERAGRLPEALNVMQNLGCALQAQDDPHPAFDVYRRILAADARRYGAWANLGTGLCVAGEPGEGARHLFQALLLAGRRVPVLTGFAETLAGQLAEKGLDLRGPPLPPGDPTGLMEKVADILTSLGKALFDLEHGEEAVVCHRMSIEIRPSYALGHWNLALALLALGEYEEGWAEYEWRWLQEPTLDPRRLLPLPRWRGKPAEGQRLMVFAEQGFGDVIQFAPLVTRLAERSRHVVFQVFPPLLRLLAHNLASERLEVTALPAHPDMIGADVPLDGFAAQMSLPHFMGLSRDELPLGGKVLEALPEDVALWTEHLPTSDRPRVGVVWAGRPQHANDRNRSLSLESLHGLVATPGIAWVSLQLGPRQGEFAAAAPEGFDAAPHIRDFADTAAVIAHLDLVIAVDTAVAHLAAAMGRPVWLLLPYAADWRWGSQSETTPWYPGMRLFRKAAIGDWDGVVARVRQSLEPGAAPAGGTPKRHPMMAPKHSFAN